ncbi:MAG: MBOAT family O-acyltransferase [Chloroflexota bacterium]
MSSELTAFFAKLSITNAGFFVFVLAVFVIYYLVPKKAQGAILLAASLAFCLSWDWSFAVILAAFSLLNYFLALRIDASRDKARSRWLLAGVALNVGALLFYKYFDQSQGLFFKALFRVGLTSTQWDLRILQPIGVSFYVLQAISYLVDVFRRQIPVNRNLLEVSLYLAYFPKLLAGPIERAQVFFDQLRADCVVDNQQVIDSLLKIFVGLSRKILISDTLLQTIPKGVFANPSAYSVLDLLFWWFAFGLMIYNDFAGYTGIARGVSGLFGIKLSPNFEQPFFSTGFMDFWNRWHMSLSNWLRDYVYLPVSRAMLRRNPSGHYLPNLIVPPLVTMLVSGIWHGAALHFIVWGLLNGALQAWERVQRSRRKMAAPPFTHWAVIGTLFLLLLFNVPFKLDLPAALDFWGGLFRWGSIQTFVLATTIKPFFVIALSFYLDLQHLPTRDETGLLRLPKATQVFLLAAGLFLLFLATRQQIAAPFIYQEF